MNNNLMNQAYESYKQKDYVKSLMIYNKYIEEYPEICSSIYVIIEIISKKISNTKNQYSDFIDSDTTLVRIDFLNMICEKAANYKFIGEK